MVDPVCFHIGSRPVYWFGVLAASGFGAALWHWTVLARREGKPPEYASDVVLWLMVGGILGARIAYVVANWEQYAHNPMAIFRIDQGGLIFYGGFLGGLLAILGLARKRGERALALGDFVISGIPLGHALGRVGCFLNGCCYGEVTTCAIGHLNGGRHPAQIYEALGDLAIFYLLAKTYDSRRFNGQTLCIYLLTYPALRFVVEFFRGDERLPFGGMTVAKWISLTMLIVGGVLWRVLGARSVRGRDALRSDTAR